MNIFSPQTFCLFELVNISGLNFLFVIECSTPKDNPRVVQDRYALYVLVTQIWYSKMDFSSSQKLTEKLFFIFYQIYQYIGGFFKVLQKLQCKTIKYGKKIQRNLVQLVPLDFNNPFFHGTSEIFPMRYLREIQVSGTRSITKILNLRTTFVLGVSGLVLGLKAKKGSSFLYILQDSNFRL